MPDNKDDVENLDLANFNFENVLDPQDKAKSTSTSVQVVDPANDPLDKFSFDGVVDNKPKVNIPPTLPSTIPSSKLSQGGKVRSGYGKRIDPISGQSAFHDGLDIPVPANTTLKPFANGVVTFVGNRGAYGNSVEIDYGGGLRVSLNHLNSTSVEVGDKVNPDALLGLSGSTGKSTGPHVHIRASLNGKSINPLNIFQNDPRKDGLDLLLNDPKDIATNDDLPSNPDAIDLSKFNFNGVLSSTENGQQDASTLTTPSPDIISNNGAVSTNFTPIEFRPLVDNSSRTLLEKSAIGTAKLTDPVAIAFNLLPSKWMDNPEPTAKPQSFVIKTKDGKIPTYKDVENTIINSLGISDLNSQFNKEKHKQGYSNASLFAIGEEGEENKPYIWAKDLGNGNYQIDLTKGIPKSSVEAINAFGTSGWKGFTSAVNGIYARRVEYQKWLDQTRATKNVQLENHPYLNKILAAQQSITQSIVRGAQDVNEENIQLWHNVATLPKASAYLTYFGGESPEYYDLIKEDAKSQQVFNASVASIPKETSLIGSIARGATSGLLSSPKFIAAGALGTAGVEATLGESLLAKSIAGTALPTLSFLEAMHKGERNAITSSMAMAIMIGGMHGLGEGLNNIDSFRSIGRTSFEANKADILSIAESAPGNDYYLTLHGAGIEPKIVNFSSMSPLARQVVLRGTNGLLMAGTSFGSQGISWSSKLDDIKDRKNSIFNPDSTLKESISGFIVGAMFPVGKYLGNTESRLARPSILSGDAYTLPSGAILLRSPIDEPSGLQSGTIPSIGNEFGKVKVQDSAGQMAVLDLDTANLNLLDLKRGLQNGSWKVNDLNLNVQQKIKQEMENKAALIHGIKTLSDAIPAQTQAWFAANEDNIKEAQRTNYQDRIDKESFIKGTNVLPKSSEQLGAEDVKPFTPISSTTPKDTFAQRTRRAITSLEDRGYKELIDNMAKREAEKDKGTEFRNSGIPLVETGDIPALTRIAIGKLGRKGLDFAEFSMEMIGEFGESIKPYLTTIHNNAKALVDGVRNLAGLANEKTIVRDGVETKIKLFGATEMKRPPFPVAKLTSIQNLFPLINKFGAESKVDYVPLDNIIATQEGVIGKQLLKLAEQPELATSETSNERGTTYPKFIKVKDDYYMVDGTHRTTLAKLANQTHIQGQVIDLDEVANGNTTSQQQRARENFGDTGSRNKYFTQEKQQEIRENFLKPPPLSQTNEGLIGSAAWLAKESSNLVQMVGFHIEDFYRRGVEPKIDEILNRLRTEKLDWIDQVDGKDWSKIFNQAKEFVDRNNADPFFSPLKQAILEKLPNKFSKEQALAVIGGKQFEAERWWISGELSGRSLTDAEKQERGLLIRKGSTLTSDELYRLDELHRTKHGGNYFPEAKQNVDTILDALQDTRGKISKSNLLDYINKNQIRIDEVVKDNKVYDRLKDPIAIQLREQIHDLTAQINILRADPTRNPASLELGGKLNAQRFELERQFNDHVSNQSDLINNSKTNWGLKDYEEEQLETPNGKNYTEIILTIPETHPYANEEVQARHKDLLEKIPSIGDENYFSINKDNYLTKNEQIELDKLNQLDEEYHNLPAPYKSGHWEGIKNPIIHFRINEYDIESVGRVGLVQEVQSDWNQAGRKHGFKYTEDDIKSAEVVDIDPNSDAHNIIVGKRYTNISKLISKDGQELANIYSMNPISRDMLEREARSSNFSRGGLAPKLPFMEGEEKNLAIKRILRYAAEKGLDGIAFTTPEMQQERYNKLFESKHIEYKKNSNGSYTVNLLNNNLDRLSSERFNDDKDLLNRLGDDTIANKIIEDKGVTKSNRNLSDFFEVEEDKQIANYKILSGAQLKKGSGYAEYGSKFPNDVKKIGKKFGMKTVRRDFNFGPEDSARSLDILTVPQELKDSVLKESQPLFGLANEYTTINNPLKPSSPIGTRNRLITRDIFDNSKNSILKNLQDVEPSESPSYGIGADGKYSIENDPLAHGIEFRNSGITWDNILDQIRIIYKDATNFSLFAQDLIQKYGPKIQDHLKDIWDWAHEKATILNLDERGSWNPAEGLFYRGDKTQLSANKKREPSIADKISDQLHRTIALAQKYPEVDKVYESVRQVQRTTNAYSTSILKDLTNSINNLRNDDGQKVAKAIFTRNIEKRAGGAPEDASISARFMLDPAQSRAYLLARNAMSNVLKLRRDTLLYPLEKVGAELGNKIAAATPGTPTYIDLQTKLHENYLKRVAVGQHYAELHDTGYISLQRIGKFRAEAEDTAFPVGDANRYLVDFTNSRLEAQKRINDWKTGGKTLASENIRDSKNPQDFFQGLAGRISPEDFDELVAGSGVPTTDPIVEAIRAEVYEKYPSLTYGLSRKFNPGYQETNEFMLKSISQQANKYAASYYNKVAGEEGLDALNSTGLDKSNPNLYKIVRQYIVDDTSKSPTGIGNKLWYQARRFAFDWQLGYSVKQLYRHAIINPITENYSYLARVENPLTGNRLGGIKGVESIFIKGTLLAGKIAKEGLGLKIKTNPEYLEFKTIYGHLRDEGVVTPNYTKSLIDIETERPIGIDNQFKSFGKRFFSLRQQEHWGATFTRAGDLASRTQMAASAFLAGKKFGLSGDQLESFITRAIDATQTNPTRGENPYFIRNFGEGGKLFYQFSAFKHMWFENLALNVKSDLKHRSAAATSRTLFPLLAVVGARGLPLAAFGATLYGLTTGRNAYKDSKDYLHKHIHSDFLENVVLNGITSNISFSKGVEEPVPILDSAGDVLTEDDAFDTMIASSMPAVATSGQIIKGFSQIAKGTYSKNSNIFFRGLETAAPKVIRQPLQVYRIATQGYKSLADKTIVPEYKLDKVDKVLPIIGLTSNKYSTKMDELRAKKLSASKLGQASRQTYRNITK